MHCYFRSQRLPTPDTNLGGMYPQQGEGSNFSRQPRLRPRTPQPEIPFLQIPVTHQLCKGVWRAESLTAQPNSVTGECIKTAAFRGLSWMIFGAAVEDVADRNPRRASCKSRTLRITPQRPRPPIHLRPLRLKQTPPPPRPRRPPSVPREPLPDADVTAAQVAAIGVRQAIMRSWRRWASRTAA